MTSVRLNILRSRKNGDLTIECVSDDLRHLKVEAETGNDNHVRLSIAIPVEPGLFAGEGHAEQASDISERGHPVDDPGRAISEIDRVHGTAGTHASGLWANRGIGHIYQSSQQAGQSKANPSSQTGTYQSYDRQQQFSTFKTGLNMRDDEDGA